MKNTLNIKIIPETDPRYDGLVYFTRLGWNDSMENKSFHPNYDSWDKTDQLNYEHGRRIGKLIKLQHGKLFWSEIYRTTSQLLINNHIHFLSSRLVQNLDTEASF